MAGVERLRHEFAVPAENRVWRKDGRPFQQSLATNGLSFHRQEPTLIVIQQQSLLFQLPEKGFDLCVLELDDLLLPLIDEPAECSEQNVLWLEQEGHVRRRKPASVRCPQVKSSG